MIQCENCEHFVRGSNGQVAFRCDPFSTIKEPECLTKWQLLKSSELGQKVDRLVAAYEATLNIYRRMQPLQEKMFEHMERELRDNEESESWKYDLEDDDDDEGDIHGKDDRESGRS
ncbi:MAG: hypothetical protein KF841_11965 [Phycisphaerae bacterium]|nr:hypothetical protein [Phycisphaerae bacterium]